MNCRFRSVIGQWCLLGVLTLCAPLHAANNNPARSYERARHTYFQFKDTPSRQQFRHHWFKVLAAFKRVAEHFPESEFAAKALYTEGELWSDLYTISRRRSDLSQALSAYEMVWLNHPASTLADDALWQRAFIFLKKLDAPAEAAHAARDILRMYPRGDMAKRARALADRLVDLPERAPDISASEPLGNRRGRPREDKGVSRVQEIKHWSNDHYTRVAIYLDGPAEVRTGQVGPDKRAGRPSRIFLDLLQTRLKKDIHERVQINDQLLAQIRSALHKENVVRVVLDLKGPVSQHRVLVMESPYRILIDAYRAPSTTPGEAHTPKPPAAPLVVLDPGHGGHDVGASSPTRVREKDVVLQIARGVQTRLQRAGIDVLLTRSDDQSVSLEERTAIANRSRADAFISIHANSHEDLRVRGIETYYLDVTDDQYAIALAALENKTPTDQVNDVQLAMSDLAATLDTEDSITLARQVQRHLVDGLTPLNPDTRDLGVKASLFYVLLGVRMPAVLVETSFLSHPQEGELLASQAYQEQAAASITQAVVQYFKTQKGEDS